jgi:hypothetical protein
MSELQDVRTMLDAAEAAANSGDLASADDLLQKVARIQEAELGAGHPDLANTFNNLAIVAETTGRMSDAERFYRRAVAVASASLPADDPKVVSSRHNLEAFCRERGVPIDAPAALVAEPELARRAAADNGVVADAKTPPQVESAAAAALPSVTSIPVPPPPPVVPNRSPSAPLRMLRTLVTVAIGVAVLVVVTLLVMRPWSARNTPRSGSTAAPPAPQTAEPSAAQQAPVHAPIEQTPAKAGTPRDTNRDASKPDARARSAGAMTLVTSQLCRTFATTGGAWRCEPVGNSVGPGPIVLYTRVRSPRDAVVIHRWYRGDALQKTARLAVRANSTEGYRTYSRQTVRAGENWRVEVRTADGDVLYEQRLPIAKAAR